MNHTHDPLHLTTEEFKWISKQIFQNECGGQDNNLTCWNENENFMSAGIGHFIWYPRDTKKNVIESFPKMLDYMETAGHQIPEWLNEFRTRGCPWTGREDFLNNFSGQLMTDLRQFLRSTLDLQVGFIIHRAQQIIEKISSILPASEQQEIIDKFNAIARTPRGFYPLIDYINFKGSGSNSSERYKGMGWGLIQVLETMELSDDQQQVKPAFVAAAVRVLERRVQNSPPERHEEKWLPGWKKRLQTYLDEPAN